MSESIQVSNKNKKKVVYYYDEDIGNYYYQIDHPMKPHRVRMTHNLILAYDLLPKMTVLRPKRATVADMTRFHDDTYIQFLQYIEHSPDKDDKSSKELKDTFNVGEDSPVFDGLFEFCQISAGGTLSAAQELVNGKAEIAINWAGGLHHAKKSEASGFCYVADCVLGILKLLERYERVMYLDIDIHHGDSVEEAFYTSDRILTVSFHKYGNFFPGTGHENDIGYGKGKYYSVNVPLDDGIDDESYHYIFKPIMSRLVEWFRPQCILLQCGADSLAGDRLGTFNLTIKGHAECVSYMKSFGIPLLVTGGGGYTVMNVSRCWTYETAVLLDQEIENNIPYNDYLGYYGPDYTLHLHPSNRDNNNTRDKLNNLIEKITENIRHLPCAPSFCDLDESSYSRLLQDSDNDMTVELYDERLCTKYLLSKVSIHTEDDGKILF